MDTLIAHEEQKRSEAAAKDRAEPAHPGRTTLTETLEVRRASADQAVRPGATEKLQRAASSSGEKLPEKLQQKFESSLGVDLGGVRVHTGSHSAAAAAAVGARAYTIGNDIHFNAGQYAPSSRAGEELLAHEVAHTVQQSGVARRAQFKLEVSSPEDAAEIEADGAARAMVGGQSASVTLASGVARKVMRAAEGGGGGAKTKVSVSVPLIKTPKQAMGYFEVSSGVSYTVQAEEVESGAKEEGEKAEAEQTVSPEGVEAEVKKQFAGNDSVKLEGSLGAGVNWKERKFELSSGLNLVCNGETFSTEAGGKFIPFTIDDSGVHLGEFKLAGKAAPKQKPTVTVAGKQYVCTPSIDWEVAVELNEEKIAEELLEKITQRIGGGAAGGALVPLGMIANGALIVFMAIDAFMAEDDIKQLVKAGPPAVEKARAFIDQTAADLKGGKGDAVDKLSQDLASEFGGPVPRGLLTKALADKASPEDLKKAMWPPMRQQIIDKSVASYRSKHKTESAFKDATNWIGEHVFDEKDNHKSTYGEDILYNTLNEILPTALS